MMNLEFEKPDLANLAIRVELRVWVMAKIFEKSQVFPALRPDGRIPPAGNQNKSVYWEIECRLLDQPIVYASKRLLANFTSRSIGQDAGFEPVVVRILSGAVQALHGSHDNCSHHHS